MARLSSLATLPGVTANSTVGTPCYAISAIKHGMYTHSYSLPFNEVCSFIGGSNAYFCLGATTRLNSARRLARREKGDDGEDTEETSSSTPDAYLDNTPARRPQRCDSRDNSTKFVLVLIDPFLKLGPTA